MRKIEFTIPIMQNGTELDHEKMSNDTTEDLPRSPNEVELEDVDRRQQDAYLDDLVQHMGQVELEESSSSNRNSRRSLQSKASEDSDAYEDDLRMVRALLAAEEAHDPSKITMAQEELLGSDMAVSEQRKDHENEKKSLKRWRSSRDTKMMNKEEGLSEEDTMAILNTEREENYVLEMKMHLQQTRGVEFFSGCEEVAADLDFWVRACLRARRFRIERACDLLTKYTECRKTTLRNGNSSKIRLLLEEGIITFLEGSRCVNGRGIIMIRMQRHDPKRFTATDVLLGIHEVLVYAIRKFHSLQAKGFVIINDMTGASTKNFDIGIPKLLSKTIDSRFPIRYGNLIVVNPPLFFSALFRIVRLFLSQKMKNRLVKLSISETDNPLEEYVPRESLPVNLGGTRHVNHNRFAADVVPPLSPSSLDDETEGFQFENCISSHSSVGETGGVVPQNLDPRFSNTANEFSASV